MTVRSLPNPSTTPPALIEQLPRETAIQDFHKREMVIHAGDRLLECIILAGEVEELQIGHEKCGSHTGKPPKR